MREAAFPPSLPPGVAKQHRFGVPDGAEPVLPVPGIYSAEGPEGASVATLARMAATSALANAVVMAPSWQSAEDSARVQEGLTPAEVPRYILTQAAGMALLSRPDYLRGPASGAEVSSAGRWLDRLNEARYAHLPDLLRLVEAVEGTWTPERVRAAAARALASDREWQIRQSARTQLVALSASIEGAEIVPPRAFPDDGAEKAHNAAHHRFRELAE